MNPQIKIKHNIGNTLEVQNVLDIRAVTYLSANINGGVTAIPVDNANDFTSGADILLLLSEMGSETSEIVKSTAHTNTSFTTTTTLQPHLRGDSVSQIAYDQIVLLKSSTENGSYSTLFTQVFQVTQLNTILFDSTGLTTDFYKIQWRNSNTGDVSPLSDPISVSTYPENSANSIIEPVLRAMGISESDKSITTEFMISSLNDARTYVKGKLFGIRHAWNQEFEYPIKLLAGTNFVNLPSTIDFNETDRSLLSARFLVNNIMAPYNLDYIDKRSWNQYNYNISGSTNPTSITSGATSIVLENTGDFDTNGSAFVATDSFGQTIMKISYTGNDKATNTLSGVTGVTRNIPAGTQIWSRPTVSQPTCYTIYDNKIYFNSVIPDTMQANNVYIDFYKKFVEITALSDVLDEPYREIYKWYLRYAVKYRKDNDTPSDDPDLVKFEGLVESLLNNLYTGQGSVIITS